MRTRGISDAGFVRLAKAVKGQEDLPPVDIDQSAKPTVLEVDKYVMDNNGNDWSYDDFLKQPDWERLLNPMSDQDLAQYVSGEFGIEIPPDADAEDIMWTLKKEGIGVQENTYNSSWWGPTIQYTLLGPATDEPYAEGVLIISQHLGGDVRGNYAADKAYKVESYVEEAPWYSCRLSVNIKTDRGTISLDAEDTEAYHFYVNSDETGIFGNDSSISYDDLQKKLDWTASGIHDIWD